MDKQNIKEEELTIEGVVYVPKDSVNKEVVNTEGLKMCMIRTYSAGVHYGYLAEEKDVPNGIKVKLLNSRRIWSWAGAASLSQLAMEGTSKPESCKIPCKVNEITLMAIEIIPMTSKAVESLNNVKVWNQ
jgi:hypothetical protein